MTGSPILVKVAGSQTCKLFHLGCVTTCQKVWPDRYSLSEVVKLCTSITLQ